MKPANIQFKNPFINNNKNNNNITKIKNNNNNNNNKPKHPYADLITIFVFLVNQLFFLFRVGRFVIIYTIKSVWFGIEHITLFISPKKMEDNPISVVDKYIEAKKQRFLETYEVAENYSSNIESCFLSKKGYENLLKNESNDVEKRWKTRILCENTPRGNIFMFYDVYKQGFSYYSDIQGIPYSLLNAVAMKYVIMFRCRDFFVDDQITPIESPSFLIKLQEEEDAEEKTKKDKKKEDLGVSGIVTKNAPFAKFKTYNTAMNKLANDSKQPSTESTTSCSVDMSAKIFTNNKFIYLGKTVNFSFIQKIPMKPTLKRELSDVTMDSSRILEELRSERKWLNYREFKQSLVTESSAKQNPTDTCNNDTILNSFA